MQFDIVHAFGAGVYCVFIVLFLLATRIPRTNPGAGWWALAMCCALVARVSLVSLGAGADHTLANAVYGSFNILEKTFLITGFVRFFEVRRSVLVVYLAAAATELWLLVVEKSVPFPVVRSTLYAGANVFILGYLAWLVAREDIDCSPLIRRVMSAACAALALHWATATMVSRFYPDWLQNGFVLGTALVMLQYMAMLTAILSGFQKRLINAETKALKMAFKDPLTGLYNKHFMNNLFDQALLLATRPHHLVAVYYIDLDNFKPVNDQAGHAVGDEVLKCVAQRLKEGVRSTDICARLGGDEFTVIATQLEHKDQAPEIAKKLLARLAAPIAVAGKQFQLGASIGISLYPLHSSDLSMLLQQADMAMYHVKSSGKSGYELYVNDNT
ncbi:diguanylate cyclase domain-containing protein [Herbaspirillum sp. NPDC087042]|uniref:diguanylate cyclase domain-containing protein n=1 Tax=Herbaspirillum sp. NPDC087042 TaxID=3364004 RepID=UPI00382D0522